MKTTLTLVAAALLAATPALAQDTPDLKGTWSGEAEGTFTGGDISGEYRLVVSEQNGRSFRGELTYPFGGRDVTEPVIGSVDPAGERVVFVGDQGHHEATLEDGVLKDCYVYASAELSVAFCVDLAKQ